jgi:hypothetical protein
MSMGVASDSQTAGVGVRVHGTPPRGRLIRHCQLTMRAERGQTFGEIADGDDAVPDQPRADAPVTSSQTRKRLLRSCRYLAVGSRWRRGRKWGAMIPCTLTNC